MIDTREVHRKTYRLRADCYEPTIKRTLRLRFGIIGGSALIIPVGMSAKLLFIDHEPPAHALLPSAFSVAVFAGMCAFAIRLAIMRGRAGWASYRLIVGADSLRRLHAGLPPMEITRAEVIRVVEHPTTGLTVLTAQQERLISIPKAIENYDEVHEQLRSWGSPDAPATPKGTWSALIRAIVMLAVWIATGVVPDLAVAMGLGVILWVLAGWSIREGLRSPLIDARGKRAIIFVFGLMMLAPVGRIVYHVINAWLHLGGEL